MKANKKNYKWAVLGGICLIGVLVIGAFLMKRLEGDPPGIDLTPDAAIIGAARDFHVRAADHGSGLRRLRVDLIQGDTVHPLLEDAYPAAGLLAGGRVHEATATVTVAPRPLRLSDGAAILRITATDYAWRGGGNASTREVPLTVDTRPPEIEVLSRAHNIASGGAALVIYRVSEPVERSGVRVGDHFYPGAGGLLADPAVTAALFALRHDQGAETGILLEAVDRAGNTARTGFRHYIRRKTFRQDTIRISDGFLRQTLPEFDAELAPVASADAETRFLYVNRTLRTDAYQKLVEVSRRSEPTLKWRGAFLRLPGSARQAGFGDRRQYIYQGREIDQQTHLGIDLAAVSRAPVPAANGGTVVYAERLSIYGNTVIIDHGLGLFSMYAHLSRIIAEPGKRLEKGAILGYTGTSGLAGGDHLHFSMLVHQTFVDPVEWWDGAWIENNITGKLRRAGAMP